MRVAIIDALHAPDRRRVAQWHRWARVVDIQLEVARPGDAADLAAALQPQEPGVEAVVVTAGTLADEPEVVRAARSLKCPLVTVEPEYPPPTAPSALDRLAVARIHGRGAESHRWALAHLAARTRWPARNYSYGPDPEQEADLRLPSGGGWCPVAVLVHGGFWRAHWGKDLMEGLALALTKHGWATWNIEYRRVNRGGGWPSTPRDATRAINALRQAAVDAPLDLGRVMLIGHSAGAQLALSSVAGSREGQETNSTRSGVRPCLVVSLGGVVDLQAAAQAGIGEGAVHEFLGGLMEEVPQRYQAASPLALLPLGVRQLLVHGDADRRVPVEQARAYRVAAEAVGDPVELLELPGMGHFELIDPDSLAWRTVADALPSPQGAEWSARRFWP